MKINILKIRNAAGEGINFEFKKKLDEITVSGQKFTFIDPVEVSGEIMNRNNNFLLKGEARALVSTNCVSCLEPFQLNLHTTIDEIYGRTKDLNDPDDEMIEFDGEDLDIEPEVIKSLLMEIPMRVVCSPDCAGLCQGCGCNLNIKQCDCESKAIDPRLAVLKKLQQ
ncbi:YceD family protein [Desulfotomaculum sp. 1211_IL3151]|uniref:YceD family protein n=1 Tax=Desulfotomaculum sp. 1211_IL3151 TaxID=3084055 RepID=UPI002FD8A384